LTSSSRTSCCGIKAASLGLELERIIISHKINFCLASHLSNKVLNRVVLPSISFSSIFNKKPLFLGKFYLFE